MKIARQHKVLVMNSSFVILNPKGDQSKGLGAILQLQFGFG